jgi:hypothetical protein
VSIETETILGSNNGRTETLRFDFVFFFSSLGSNYISFVVVEPIGNHPDNNQLKIVSSTAPTCAGIQTKSVGRLKNGTNNLGTAMKRCFYLFGKWDFDLFLNLSHDTTNGEWLGRKMKWVTSWLCFLCCGRNFPVVFIPIPDTFSARVTHISRE